MTLVDKIIKKIEIELNKENRIEYINKNIIEPIIYNCIKSLYPYIMILMCIITILFILILSILIISIKTCYK